MLSKEVRTRALYPGCNVGSLLLYDTDLTNSTKSWTVQYPSRTGKDCVLRKAQPSSLNTALCSSPTRISFEKVITYSFIIYRFPNV